MNSRLERSCYVVVVIIGLLVVLLSCSKNPTDSNDRGNPQYNTLLDGVTFEPSSGAPGTIITMIGLDSLPADSGFSLTIGNEPAPLIAESGHTIRTAIPLFIDTTISSWPITRTGLQAVVLLYNGVPVDTALDAIAVDSLLPAPEGTMDTVMVKLSTGATAIKDIAMSIGAGDTLLMATCDAIDELLYTGTYSLTALLNGTSPVSGYDSSSGKLFTSLLVSSGLFDVIGRWSDTLVVTSRIAQQLSNEQTNTNFLTDEQLASRMQLHDFLAGFGAQVVGQTALDWQVASGILGAVALAAPIVGIYEFVVSWVLGELDFIINKLAIAMLPSDVTRLDLDFYNHQITVGDTTEAIVRISAKNNPPNITPADIIGQVLGGLQLTQWIQDRLGPTVARTLRSVIVDIVNWVFGVITSFLSANYNSPTSLDVALPTKTWDSVWVHNPGLVDLIIPDLSKLGYINGSFNGQAKDSIGPIGLQMRTQPPGPSMYVNSILSSLGYAGGAFGDGLTTSNIDTVTIVGELALEVDFADVITVGGANVLGVNAGYLDRNGTPHWVQDIEISISVTDGSADSTHGYTDAQGHFSSIIKIDSTADSVTVHIFAYGEFNSQADTVVTAHIESDGQIAFVCSKGGAFGIWTMNEDGSNLQLLSSIDHLAKYIHDIQFMSASPDGNYISFGGNYLKDPYTSYSPQLYICNSTGMSRRVGRDLRDMFYYHTLLNEQMWVQNELHTVLFTAFKKVMQPNPSALFIENVETFVRDSLGPTPYDPQWNLPVESIMPVCSPDGSRIAFFSGGEGTENISICNIDGTNQHISSSGIDGSFHQLFWTNDGNHVVAILNPYASSVQVFPIGSGIGTEIISNSGAVYEPNLFHTANAFAYLAITDVINEIPQGSLRFYSFEDNAVHNVMSSVSTWDIALSPDDKSIVYANEAMGGDIFIVNVETGVLTQLTFEDIGARQIIWYSKQP